MIDYKTRYKHGDNMTSMIYDDRHGTIFGLRGKWLFSYKEIAEGRWMIEPLAGEQSTVYFDDRSDELFFAGEDGIRVNNINATPLYNTDSLGIITCLYSIDDDLWIGTRSNGLFHYDRASSATEPIVDMDWIRAIHPDTDSTLLVSTYDGLLLLPRSTASNMKPVVYDIRDGLATNEIQGAYYDGRQYIYVATSDGMHKIDRTITPRSHLKNTDLFISTINISGNSFPVDSDLKLHHDQNDVDIQYHLTSYSSEGQITYETMLEPLETDWRQTTKRQVNYLSLKPAIYTFHLKATDIYGGTVVHKPLRFKIQPAYWQTLWFKALIGGLAGLCIYFIIKRRDEKKQALLLMEKNLHTKIAELELSALKAQMNPHFIFNALGAIQYYIQVNEIDKADDYLTKFALLMRKYLDGSKEKFITIREEVELLKIYLILERMRFEDKFTFTIHVDPELHAGETHMPTMLVQPFVENAINHGLTYRDDGQGQLDISFNNVASDIIVTITDNGIGRALAKKHTRAKHKSRGMHMIHEKIENLRAAGLSDVMLEVVDLDKSNEKYPGTFVTLKIKKQEDED